MDDQRNDREGSGGILPRFGLRPVLVVIAVASLWLSTLTAYPGSSEVQQFIWVAIVVTSGVAIFHCAGRVRAFWMGFFGTALLGTTRAIGTFGGGFRWTQKWSRDLSEYIQVPQPRQGQLMMNINTALILGSVLIGAALVGFLCAITFGDRNK
jgi:hypothetical protein